MEDVDEKPIKCGQLLLSLDLLEGYDVSTAALSAVYGYVVSIKSKKKLRGGKRWD